MKQITNITNITNINNKIILGIGLGILILIFIIIIKNYKRIEGFTHDSMQEFLRIQDTINHNKVFDMNVIQATQEELDYFNQHKMWPWSEEVIKLYKKAVSNNPYIRTLPKDSVNYNRTVYNQNGILKVLSYETKEGDFLINGIQIHDPSKLKPYPSGFGDFGYNSSLIKDNKNDTIKCNMDTYTLEKTTFTENIENTEDTEKTTKIEYDDLEDVIPGFKFINGPCNPCKALTETPDYSCPFSLKVKNKYDAISSVWKYLWKI